MTTQQLLWSKITTQKCDRKHPYQHGVEAICRLQLVAVRFCGFTFLFLVILCILNWAVCGKWEQNYSKRITNMCEYSCCIYMLWNSNSVKHSFDESMDEGYFSSLSEGIDFYYGLKQHAQKMVDFLQCTVPCRWAPPQSALINTNHPRRCTGTTLHFES